MLKTTSRVLIGALAATIPLAAVAPAAFAADTSSSGKEVKCVSPRDPKLARKLQKDIVSAIGNHRYIAVSLYDRTTGTRCSSPLSHTQFDSASVVKPVILGTLLMAKKGDLTDDEKTQATKMIQNSDNTAASALWKELSDLSDPSKPNADLVKDFLKKAGMDETTIDPEFAWGLTQTTSADQIKLLQMLTGDKNDVLKAPSRQYILDLMHGVQEDQRWGATDGAPAASIAVKNGWLQRSQDGPDNDFDRKDWKVNSITAVTGHGKDGAVYDTGLAILTEGNRVPEGEQPFVGFKSGVENIQRIAQAVNKRLYPGLSDSERFTPPAVTPEMAADQAAAAE
ncbi:serine hydrolase [Streptomyces sp. NPDC059918]|uniref:serine hydrolase n=1 Tax=unclassified Streptomyces TaxID=2593676 RepID=UPI00365B978F